MTSKKTKKTEERTLNDAVADGIKACRMRAKISQGELARRIGVNRQQIQRLESGQLRITVERVECIAKALDCDVDDIYHHDQVIFPATPSGVFTVYGAGNSAVTFQDSLLDSLLRGNEHGRLELVQIHSDDVARTAKSGDYVLLDRSVKKVSAYGLFLITTWAEEMVWRYLAPLPTPEHLRVYADDEHIVDAEVQIGDLTILGRCCARIAAI